MDQQSTEFGPTVKMKKDENKIYNNTENPLNMKSDYIIFEI